MQQKMFIVNLTQLLPSFIVTHRQSLYSNYYKVTRFTLYTDVGSSNTAMMHLWEKCSEQNIHLQRFSHNAGRNTVKFGDRMK